ncbi:N-acetyltransferase [Staphylococcus schleiferi]|nr:N-acetyltransferase [Staphylococcus schleiferi]
MTGRNLTVTDQGKKEKHPVTRENYRQFLADYFNITHTPILFFEPEETE